MSDPEIVVARIGHRMLAALWDEVERIVHGGEPCPLENCPHLISLPVLLIAMANVDPMPNVVATGPPHLVN